jgi:nucleotide-binding universal stress UspA family protein
VAMEQGSDLVLMGLAPPSRLGRWLFGDLVDATCRQVPCPVVVVHLVSEPSQWRRLLVPIKDLTAGAMEQFQLAERLAAALGASITLLHLHDPRLAAGALADLQRDLERWRPGRSGVGQGVAVTLDLQPSHGVEAAILHSSSSHDLVILRSQRRLVAGLPIPASDLTNRLLHRLSGTTLVISDPLH